MTSRPVLCAVDISNKDKDVDVLKLAHRMAKLDDAQLDVITVVPDFGMSVVGSFFEPHHHEKALAEAQRLLQETVESAIGAEANENVRHVVATGNAYEEILKAANLAETGLIVIGAQKPDFKDYLLGPNASRVVRHSECSVLVVR
ncbi:universal stress protein [uncultured Roseovarius sp.]|uniref:universal stress protein n=1 Tax=uncultured Roseovarius sp. TaxID=293344 RepID=UPI002632D563|nr:universal stress protein [uncultured Roseovarius sp.]